MYISKKKHQISPEARQRPAPFVAAEREEEKITAIPVPAQPDPPAVPDPVSVSAPADKANSRLDDRWDDEMMPERRIDAGQLPLTEDTGELAVDTVEAADPADPIGTAESEKREGTEGGHAAEQDPDRNSYTALGDLPAEKGETNYDDFLRLNTGEGILRIQASAAEQSFPLSGVTVEVYRDFDDGRHIFYRSVTDLDGVIDGLRLPAPPKKNSLSPDMEAPFVTYGLTARRGGDTPLTVDRVPIFTGVKSIQPIRLSVPSGSGGGTADTVLRSEGGMD